MIAPDEPAKTIEEFNDWLSRRDGQRQALGIALAELLLPLLNEYLEQMLTAEDQQSTTAAGNEALTQATTHPSLAITGGRHVEQ